MWDMNNKFLESTPNPCQLGMDIVNINSGNSILFSGIIDIHKGLLITPTRDKYLRKGAPIVSSGSEDTP